VGDRGYRDAQVFAAVQKRLPAVLCLGVQLVVAQQVDQGFAPARGFGDQQDPSRVAVDVVDEGSGRVLALGLQQQFGRRGDVEVVLLDRALVRGCQRPAVAVDALQDILGAQVQLAGL